MVWEFEISLLRKTFSLVRLPLPTRKNFGSDCNQSDIYYKIFYNIYIYIYVCVCVCVCVCVLHCFIETRKLSDHPSVYIGDFHRLSLSLLFDFIHNRLQQQNNKTGLQHKHLIWHLSNIIMNSHPDTLIVESALAIDNIYFFCFISFLLLFSSVTVSQLNSQFIVYVCATVNESDSSK